MSVLHVYDLQIVNVNKTIVKCLIVPRKIDWWKQQRQITVAKSSIIFR